MGRKKWYGPRGGAWTEVRLAGRKVAFTHRWADYEGDVLAVPEELLEPAARRLRALLLLGSSREEAEAAVLEWLEEQVTARRTFKR